MWNTDEIRYIIWINLGKINMRYGIKNKQINKQYIY